LIFAKSIVLLEKMQVPASFYLVENKFNIFETDFDLVNS